MFKFLTKRLKSNLDYPLMRDPKFQPKCYEMTEEERLTAVRQNIIHNRNVWNDYKLTKEDR